MKKRLLLPIIILIVILSLGFGSKIIIQRTNTLSFLSGTTLEEKELSTVANTMYVTMLDKKAKVIATTNPETQIDSNYSFTDTQKPKIQPNTTDEYFILFDIVDTNGSSGYTKVEENVIYTLELPEYITPTDAYDEGIEPTEKCTQFSKKGQTVACGGIYKNEDKYIFKVIFSNTLNKRNVKASYQFTINLNKKIEDNIFTLKTIDFGLPGAIQLYIGKEEVPVTEEKDYDVKFKSVEWTSRTKNYAKWTVTITDLHTDGYRMNGSLYIDFGSYMEFFTDQNHWYDKIKIYADGEELTNLRNGIYTTLFKKNNQTALNGYASVSMINMNEYPSGYSYSSNQLKIDMTQIQNNTVQNTNIEGIHEWEIEFITKEYSEVPTTYNAQIRFIDNNDLKKEYEATASINNYSKNSFYFTNTPNIPNIPNNINGYGVAESLTFKVNINNNSNLLKIKSIPEYNNSTNLYYIMDAIGFKAMYNDLSGSIQVKINGKEINFTKNGYSYSSAYKYSNGYKTDPLITKLFEKTDLYSRCGASSNSYCLYFKSTETNEDGDYYWIILSDSTALKAENLSNGIYDYINPDNYSMPKPAEWELTILNAKGSNVEIKWNQNLQFYDRVSERIDNYYNYNNYNKPDQYGAVLLSKLEVNGSSSLTSSYPNLYSPLRIKGEVLNDNFIKWEMKIDTQYMHTLLEDDSSNYNLSKIQNLLLFFKIPNQQYISPAYYYDVDTNSIVRERTANSISTAYVSNCIQGNNTYDSNYDLFECTKYEEESGILRGYRDYTTTSDYPNSYYLTHIDEINDYTNYYNVYSTSFIPKSINNLQGNQHTDHFDNDQSLAAHERIAYPLLV